MNDSLLPNLSDPLWPVLLRLLIDGAALYIIIFLIYARFARSREHMFPFFLMGIMIFLICNLLKRAEMQLGMALGLFAIFSIMRFRTENLLSKNMAYLFTVIGISVINAMFDLPHPVRGTIMLNLVIILTVLVLEIALSKYDRVVVDKVAIKAAEKAEEKAAKKAEKKTGKKTEKEKDKIKEKKFIRHQVLYDKLELLNQDRMDELITDLSKRTGTRVDKVKIRKIDLINQNAELDVYYKDKSGKKEEEVSFTVNS
jgi:hypothetical protein